MKLIPQSFYNRDTLKVAKELIGKILVRKTDTDSMFYVISETEAYRSDDPACHAHRGKTLRNAPLFGPIGRTYVYLSYGIHYCLNIVSRDTQHFPSGGVLIRSIIPIVSPGIEYSESLLELPRIKGPGNVTKRLKVNKEYNEIDITDEQNSLSIIEGVTIPPSKIESTPRIGISKAVELHWRFIIKDH